MTHPIQSKPVHRTLLASTHTERSASAHVQASVNGPYKGTCFTNRGCGGMQLNNISHHNCCAYAGLSWQPGPGAPIPNVCTDC